MKIQKPERIRQGEAIFYAPEPCLWDMRQAAKQAALDEQPAQQFIVTHEEMYYPNMLNRLLSTPDELREEALSLGEAITGEVNGCIRCALLWESGWEGILLHRERDALLCAYVPAMTKQAAHGEHELALTLATLAEQAVDTPIMLDTGLQSGKKSLRELLHYLSEQMDI